MAAIDATYGYLCNPFIQIEDVNGVPVVGGKVYVYDHDTQILSEIYDDFQGHLATNPVVLDELGNGNVIGLTTKIYDIAIRDKDDNLLMSKRNIMPAVFMDETSIVNPFITITGRNGILVDQYIAPEDQTQTFTIYPDLNVLANKSWVSSNYATLNELHNNYYTSAYVDANFLRNLSAGTNIQINDSVIDVKNNNCEADQYSVALGNNSRARNSSFANGQSCIASGDLSHAEGINTVAKGDYSHAEGNNTSAVGTYSHAEGDSTESNGWHTHTEGSHTSAIGSHSHAEGAYTRAVGEAGHAEGYGTTAKGAYSHSEGRETIANREYQSVFGQWNAGNTDDLFQVGNGSSLSATHNIFGITTSSIYMQPEHIFVPRDSSFTDTNPIDLVQSLMNRGKEFFTKKVKSTDITYNSWKTIVDANDLASVTIPAGTRAVHVTGCIYLEINGTVDLLNTATLQIYKPSTTTIIHTCYASCGGGPSDVGVLVFPIDFVLRESATSENIPVTKNNLRLSVRWNENNANFGNVTMTYNISYSVLV